MQHIAMSPSLRMPQIDSTAGDEHAGGSRSSGVSHSALTKAIKCKRLQQMLKFWVQKEIFCPFLWIFEIIGLSLRSVFQYSKHGNT